MICGWLRCRAVRVRYVAISWFVLLFVGALLAVPERSARAQQATPKSPAPATSASPPDAPSSAPAQENAEAKPTPEAAKPAATVIEGVVLMQEGEAPVAGATVSIAGTQVSTQTDAQGRFTLEA